LTREVLPGPAFVLDNYPQEGARWAAKAKEQDMDSQADQPFGGGAGPAGGEGQPYGAGQQPHGGGQQPYPGQQPYSGGQQPYPGQQPYSGQQPYPDPQPYSGQQPYPDPQPYSGQQYPGPQPYGAGPPPFGGQTATGRPKVRPGRIWYLAALAVFLGGVAWLVFGLLSIGHQIDSFPRVPLPAGGPVTLNHSGGYVIYYEGPGAKSGQIPGFHVRIVPAASSPQMGSLKTYSGSLTYSFGSHQGRAVLALQVARGGRFLVQPFGAPSHSDLAFGSSIAGGIVGIVLGSLALIFAGIAAAIVLLVIRIIKTRRARAAAMQPTWQQATGQ
jgi:hypothetical protein